MARPKGDSSRIVGIEDRGGEGDRRFRVRFYEDGRPGIPACFATKDEADNWIAKFRRTHAEQKGPTVEAVVDSFLSYMQRERWRPGSQTKRNAYDRLKLMLRDVLDLPIGAVTEGDLTERQGFLFDDGYAIKTVNECVIVVGQFFRWCLETNQRKGDPSKGLKTRKGANSGKATLNIDEANLFRATVDPAAEAGDESALVALMALLLGCRAVEIITRAPRDVDAGGTLLRSWDSKKATALPIKIPECLQGPLKQQAAKQLAAGSDRLFSMRYRDWPNIVVKDWCRKAGVPVITCQGMRGTHDSIAVEVGIAPDAVAAATGHTLAVMKRSYLAKGALASGKALRVVNSLETGKGIGPNPSRPEIDAATSDNQTALEPAA